MVTSTRIKCDGCGTVFYVKYQLDEMVRLYPWNLDFYCPDCGDRIHLTYNSKGLNCKCENIGEDREEKAYLIGYSSTLPITEEMYMIETDRVDRMINFSPFFNLSRLFPDPKFDIVSSQLSVVSAVLNNLFKYRSSLSDLLPLLNKPDMKPEAYTRKVAKVFGIKAYKRDLSSFSECMDHYSKMVWCCYMSLLPPSYDKAPYGTLFTDLNAYIDGMTKADCVVLKEELNQYYNLKTWLTKQAFSHIAKMVAKIEKYFPAFAYGVIGDYLRPHKHDLYLVTINTEEVNNDYRRGYEVLEKILPSVLAFENKVCRGDINSFGEGLKYTMDDFLNLSVGYRVKVIQENPVIKSYFEDCLISRIRDSESHEDADYYPDTQTCLYPDLYKPEDVLEIKLMDVAFMTYIQLLHIMEISLIINKLLQKTWQ